MNKDIIEIYTYFRLSSYRDSDYILPEEYEELEELIKRNDNIKYLEDLRYEYIKGIINEVEYNNKCDNLIYKLSRTK